jgi:uncharacterized membrane protein YfcA
VSPLDVVLGFLVMVVGGCLQGAVGFGSNLVAAPLLILLDESFVPAPIVVASLLLNALMIRREGQGAFDPTVKPAMVAQVPGAIGAGVVLAVLPERGLSLLFAALVLVGVGVSAAGWHLRPTRRTLAGAGFAAGFMGTISGIGGPPVALVYQRSSGPALRATLSRFFLVGGVVSLAVLVASGRVDADDLRACLVTVPGSTLGFAASAPVARRLDRGSVRPVVLVVSSLAAAAVVLREVL